MSENCEASTVSVPELRSELARLAALAEQMAAALEELVQRCDGAEGVRADQSNIQTIRAHAALNAYRGEKS